MVDEFDPTPAQTVPRFKSFKATIPSEQEQPKPVPQFRTFKSTTAAFNEEATYVRDGSRRDGRHKQDTEDERRKRHSSHKHHDREDKRDRSTERRRKRHHRSKSHSRSRSPRRKHKERKETIGAEQQDPTILPWDTPDLPYRFDTRGDKHNLTYGTIHRYNIPKYYRYGRDRVLGLNRSVRIEEDKGDGKGLITGRFEGNKENLRSKGRIYALDDSKPLKVKTEANGLGKGFVEGWNFLEFSERKRKQKGDEIGRDVLTGPVENIDYRSIDGLQKISTVEELDSDLEYITSEDENIGNFDTEVRERTIKLSRLVEAEPQNLDAWYALMDHQEVITYGDKEKRRRKVKQGERQGLEEVKLGIIEKAISKNKGNVKLLLEYMKIGSKIWEPSKLGTKWKDILSRNSTMIELWAGYINFRQSDFATFRYRDCLQVYEECLEKLRISILRHSTTAEEKAASEEILLYVLLRATLFMKQAGFSELGIATWQGILEMASSLPKKMSKAPKTMQGFEGMLESFESFWDSEVLRIGEAKAKGWAAYADDDAGEFPEPKELPEDHATADELDLGDEDLFGSWSEREHEMSSKIPARTTDETEEDDPYRVILFNDLRPFLYCFHNSTIKERLAEAFLIFNGVIVPSFYLVDEFLRLDIAEMPDRTLNRCFWPDSGTDDVKFISWVNGAPMEAERRGRFSRNLFMFRSPDVPRTPETLFSSSSSWFSSIEVPSENTELLLLAMAALKDYVLRVSDEDVALLYFAVECKRVPLSNKRLAKVLLKKYSQSLQLWNAYAMSEWALGNKQAAEAVYLAALKMSSGFPPMQRRKVIELWRSWIWAEITEDNDAGALKLLLSIPRGQVLTSEVADTPATAILRTKRFLEEEQQMMLTEQEYCLALAYAELLCLLPQSDLKQLEDFPNLAPLLVLEKEYIQVPLRKQELEKLYLVKARLCYQHARITFLYKASFFRTVLATAILEFPTNSAFLSLYAWNESRSKIESRMRNLLQDVVLENGKETVGTWIVAIWSELQMSSNKQINASAVRSLFERAVECERTRSSIQLWLLYMRFELRVSQAKRARDLLFRALRACPWSKGIILFAFKTLRSALEFAEMRRVYAVMIEKELRVHVSMEELLEDCDAKASKSSISMQRSVIAGHITLPQDDESE